MANITNTDPVVTEAKLTEFYNDIKPFLGCPAYVTQEGDAEYYSTDEKVIGRWYDGKPIYQKTLVLNVSDLTGTWPFKYYSLNSYGIDKPVSISGLHKVGSDWYKTPDIELASTGFNSNYSVSMTFRNTTSNNQILICAQSSVHSTLTDFIITIQYTKLADSATTTVEQKSTHYSTDEQVVGYWINGKPLYQRTFTGTTPASGNTPTVITDLGSTVNVKTINGVVFNNNTGLSISVNYYGNSNYYSHCYVSDRKLYIEVNGYVNLSYAITLEYVKSTD